MPLSVVFEVYDLATKKAKLYVVNGPITHVRAIHALRKSKDFQLRIFINNQIYHCIDVTLPEFK
jgi:hypothetical protein